MGPRRGRNWKACPGLRLAAQVGLIGLVIAAVGKCIEKTRKGGVGIVSWEAWPGSAQGADWAGGGASGHAPGLVSWPSRGNMGGLSARIRQLSLAPQIPVGGGSVCVSKSVGKDPRWGQEEKMSAVEEALIARARLLGIRLGEASNPGPCKIASVNVTSLWKVAPAILKLDWDVLCVQE